MTSDQRSTRSLLLGIWGHLSRRRRVQLGVLLLVMLASGAAELLSLGAVLPFLAVLTDVQGLWQQPLVRSLAAQVGITPANQAPLILAVTLVFAAAAVLAAAVRLLNLRLNSRLAAAVGSDLSCEAYRRTLYQPYGVHVQRNSSTVITATSTQIELTVGALNALLQLITSAVVAVGLLVGLLWIDVSIALAVMVLFGSAYGVLALVMRRELRSNGIRIAEAFNQQLKALQEGLGAIRDVLLDGSQAAYLQIYRQADLPLRQLQAKKPIPGCVSPLCAGRPWPGGDRVPRGCPGAAARQWRRCGALVRRAGSWGSTLAAGPAAGVCRLGHAEGLQRIPGRRAGDAGSADARADQQRCPVALAAGPTAGGCGFLLWPGPPGGAQGPHAGDPSG
jgi:ABC-type multidrug transport system fused ATPase/permease subunit